MEDANIIYNILDTLFNKRCSPPTAAVGIGAPAELQSICIAENCPLDPNANCSAYPDNGIAKIPVNVTKVANGTSSSSSAVASPTGTATLNETVVAGLAAVGIEMLSLPVMVVAVGSICVALSML